MIPFGSQRVNGCQTLQSSANSNFYRMLHHSDMGQSWKTSFLVRYEMLGLVFNPFTADARYCRHNNASFLEPIQMHLSLKAKPFLQYFIAFLKSR